jgi:hypothetical protein
VQMARNATDAVDGALLPVRFALYDRDRKFCASFRAVLRSGGVQPLILPSRSPNLNALLNAGCAPSSPRAYRGSSSLVKFRCGVRSLSSCSIITKTNKSSCSSLPLSLPTHSINLPLCVTSA